MLADALHISPQEAYKLAKHLWGTRKHGYYAPRRPQDAPGTLKIPQGVGPLLPQHRSYLQQRGFNPGNLEKMWKIGGIGLASRLAWRIFIPVTLDGEVVSWTTRAITDDIDVPYINAKKDEEKYPLKALLLGEELVRHTILVVEGPLDVFAIGPGTCCTFGVQYTQEQMCRIARYPRRVIAFDNEPLAQRQARKLVKELSAWPGETYNIILDSGKDASRASKEDVHELRRRFLD